MVAPCFSFSVFLFSFDVAYLTKLKCILMSFYFASKYFLSLSLRCLFYPPSFLNIIHITFLLFADAYQTHRGKEAGDILCVCVFFFSVWTRVEALAVLQYSIGTKHAGPKGGGGVPLIH